MVVLRRSLISSLEQIPRAAPDRILGLTEQFARDTRRQKVNLTVGVYKDGWGQVTTFPSVARAQKLIDSDFELNTDLSYLPITGCPEYSSAVLSFLFGESCPQVGPRLLEEGRVSFAQTLSGTGALAVASKLLALFLSRTVWISEPSWPNHQNIFRSNGFTDLRTYPYYQNGRLVVDEWLEKLKTEVRKDPETRHSIILHACCHNPTGLDPTREEWVRILDTVHELGMIPILDMAYQGLESGNPPADAYVLRMALDEKRYKCWPNGLFVCQSFAKNMGLYGERVGSLSVVTPPAKPHVREHVDSQLKQIVRSIYSSPPGYGSRVATMVLSKSFLRMQWYKDVAFMTERLSQVRHNMHNLLKWPGLMNFQQQHGMFYYTGLSPKQVDVLRDKYSIYMTMDGRLSLSGVNDHNIDYVCEALDAVSKIPR
ncbi:aspartate transaminase AAT1 TDEL_0A02510 [Torulaspora delbrueckii]|uniref:Aspartate aminotransferase n=1 Tax=Torulaspora delbrueckii TaxID=4950 RepID=G8ZLT9_TORDE|nr:hypothetical protein TDEL_0A02510 [Torulaspora delbrueckii]CCE89583.1 hypothetical protein TDEL_0A02510 [Torulaspora delbrueckii]